MLPATRQIRLDFRQSWDGDLERRTTLPLALPQFRPESDGSPRRSPFRHIPSKEFEMLVIVNCKFGLIKDFGGISVL